MEKTVFIIEEWKIRWPEYYFCDMSHGWGKMVKNTNLTNFWMVTGVNK